MPRTCLAFYLRQHAGVAKPGTFCTKHPGKVTKADDLVDSMMCQHSMTEAHRLEGGGQRGSFAGHFSVHEAEVADQGGRLGIQSQLQQILQGQLDGLMSLDALVDVAQDLQHLWQLARVD